MFHPLPQPTALLPMPASHGATVSFSFVACPRSSPHVLAHFLRQNDPTMSQLVADVGAQLAAADAAGGSRGGSVRVAAGLEPCMAAEDFSFYGREVPAAFTFLGIADEAKGTTTGLHNPRFMMVGTRPKNKWGRDGLGGWMVVGPSGVWAWRLV